ncbi:MAG: hypothetical protein ACM3N5_08920 [Candidatus Eiseniibacteriota bacterium]
MRDFHRQPPRARAIRHGEHDNHGEGIRRFWVAFTLAVITSFGVCSLLLAAAAAGLALFS